MPKNNCEISEKQMYIQGTHWHGGGGEDGYFLRFETEDKALYKYMEKCAQKCIDRAHRFQIKHSNKEVK